jgi:hypothetical protein
VNQVDPYTVQIPDDLVDPKTGRLTIAGRNWFQYDNRWKHDLWQSLTSGTGGVTSQNDFSSVNTAIFEDLDDTGQISLSPAVIEAIDSAIPPLPIANTSTGEGPDGRDYYYITANHTTAASEYIVCNNTSAINITLNASPSDFERVTVLRRNASVSVSGTINGVSTFTMSAKYDTTSFIYLVDIGEWAAE